MSDSLLVLHGFTGSSSMWDEVCEGLPPHLRIFAIDLLGHELSRLGEHTPGVATPPWSFEEEIDRLGDALIALPEPAHVCGYSLGARVALSLAVRHPGRCASLTLIGVHPGLEDTAEREARRRDDDQLAALLRGLGMEWFVRYWERRALFASQSQLDTARLQAQRVRRLCHKAEGLARSLEVLGLGRMPAYWSALPKLTMPVRLLVGAEDAKFAAIAERIRTLRPATEVQVVDGAGHNLVLERPDVVRATLDVVLGA